MRLDLESISNETEVKGGKYSFVSKPRVPVTKYGVTEFGVKNIGMTNSGMTAFG